MIAVTTFRGITVYINPDHITKVVGRNTGGSGVTIIGEENVLICKESPEVVVSEIEAAQK